MVLFSPEYFAFIRHGSLVSARAIVPLLQKLTKTERVLDVACGTGEWLRVFREHGAERVFGVDAAWVDTQMLSIAPEEFRIHDIAEPLALDETFDVALMLEAAQHVPEDCAGAVVRSLTQLAPCVLFSAPIPNQGGSGHCVNEQWPSYWAAHFADNDFVCIDLLRRLLWDNEQVEWWYAQNLLLFVHKAEVAKSDLLSMAVDASPGPPQRLIHPKLYESKCYVPPQPRRKTFERVGRVLQFGLKIH
ncbi:MAG: class I SAM-dependent methyltransferase [Candidatus Hydrogenedentes bacterium]|nr:class I SAM-dependent methyltransferase [Candidatus Hydrogenedentota bacterium]